MNLSDNNRARFGAALAGAAFLGVATDAAATSNLNDPGDFGQIAKAGFSLTVNGSFYIDPANTEFPNLQPNVGDYRNSYSWSAAWFDNTLWIGTNREPFNSDRYAAGPAEIWRFTPCSLDPNDASANWGLCGHWERTYVSPNVSRLIAWASGGSIPSDFPRDAGYRNMRVCNAGDQVERLYVTATGLPPNILYWTGSTFATTSTSGFPTTLFSLLDTSTADTGFRGLACFKGRLFASPAGTFNDVDISNHPVLLMNPNPAGGSGWQTVLDVKNGGSGTPAGMADPDNIGIFQVNALGNYLWLSTINRTTGFELWRGDGTNCQEPWVGNSCNITWTKVIDNGAGRPPDNFGPPIDNAGATLGVYGNDLYVAPSESGFYQETYAELLRVKDAGTSTNPKWQLLAGWPRKDFADSTKRLPGLENLDCTGYVRDMANPGEQPAEWTTSDNSLRFFRNTWLNDTELDDDSDADDCMPATGSGPGLGLDPDHKNPLLPGPNNYLWRMAEHDGSFFIGSLDTGGGFGRGYPGESSGFNLYRTENGVEFTTVVNNGLGNPDAYGVRSLVSTPIGLAVGSANGYSDPENGGTDVFIGTTAPAGQASPKADAGNDQFKYDTGKTGTVSFTLQGGGTDSFGGAGLSASPYQWYQGSLADLGGDCTNISATPVSTDPNDPSLSVPVSSNSPNPEANSYTYTLRVTNQTGKVGCDQVTVTASYNLAPSVDPWYSGTDPMWPSVPANYGSGRSRPSVNLIDPEADGESYEVTAFCQDPEARLVRCELQSLDSPGVTLTNVSDTTTDPSLCTGMTTCAISARLNVPDWTTLADNGSNNNSSLRPDVQVLAVDDQGYQDSTTWESLAQPIVNTDPSDTNPTGNDAPVCRNADVLIADGQDHVTFDPAAFSPPICVDPDGDPLTYEAQTAGPFPQYGTVTFGTNTVTYTADSLPAPGFIDYFEIRALDPSGLRSDSGPSGDTMIRVSVFKDRVNPELAVTFPSNGTDYTAADFLAGCSTPGGDVCGTASDDASGVAKVQVSIQQDNPPGQYWNCTDAFDSPTEQWCDASGTTGWSLPFTPPGNGDFRLRAKAIDGGNNESSMAEASFGQHAESVPPTLSIAFPGNGANYSADAFRAGCSTPGGDLCGTASDNASGVAKVQVSIQENNPPGQYWNCTNAFDSPTEQWCLATVGAGGWSLPLTPLADGDYRVRAQATDGAGNDSTVAEATFGQHADANPPSVSISFPANGSSYRTRSFSRGCSTSTADICGSASDAETGVSSVEISIQRTSDGAWWNGSAFVAGGQLWLPASGTASWSYNFSPARGSYALQAQATDGNGNTGTSATVSFTRLRF